ncbi:MAG: MFS transporter [Nitrospira sp.]|nr:MFS transporter [Nitrospira sp.]MBX3342470.1 MFS transporter [Nitrospira sp.]MBX3370093.1 MFS transporter [Nitrospira sp.]MBX7038978.1 MFS transporter [Nitrospira sp.]MCW5795619.1 MFS transporter [Nitrospira sp.]
MEPGRASGTGPGRPNVKWSPHLLTRDFTLVWWGQMVSQIGDGVSKLALLWFVYSITGSPLKTTMIGLLQTLPPILFGPFIGVIVDRVPKKLLLISSDLIRALVLGVLPCLLPVDSFSIERLYLMVFVHAVASAVFGPALTAAIPSLVSRHEFTAANALLQTTTSIGIIVGPALSGVGIATMSSQEVLCVNAVSYVISALCFLLIRFPRTETVPAAEGGSLAGTLRDVMEGFQYVLHRQRVILMLIGAASMYTFATSAFSTLFPVFGKKLLDLGPIEVGYLWSAFGVGLLLVSLGLVSLSSWSLPKRIQLMAVSSFISGLTLLGLLFTSNRLVAAVLMVIIGMGAGTLTPVAWGVLQEIAPTTLLGRVLAIYNLGAMTSAIAGMTIFGWVTQEFGERPSVFGIGVGLFLSAVVSWRVARWVQVNWSETSVPAEEAARSVVMVTQPTSH